MGMMYQGAVEATPKYLQSLFDFLPEDAIFNVTPVGSAQLPLTTMAMILGGCIRVGMEDNIYYRKGELVKNNAQFVAQGREDCEGAEQRTCNSGRSEKDTGTHKKVKLEEDDEGFIQVRRESRRGHRRLGRHR